MSDFGAVLRRLRLAAGLTQEALAGKAGISARAVSDLERDPDRSPRPDTVTLLADALGLRPEQRARLLAAVRPRAGHPPIPRPLTPLIGRDDVVAALAELLGGGEVRLLTLTGPGGVGKTRVGLEVAFRVAGDYTDGVVFADLAPLRDPDLVIAAVARGFGLDDRDATPVGERLAVVLREKAALLVLDNFEHVARARTDVLRLLTACPGVTALVTSRVPLRVRGEREYRIAPLEVASSCAVSSPASELFVERARASGVDVAGNVTVAEICRRLDGLPLAIELAAARVRLLSPEQLLDRLDQRLPLLTDGPHDLPDRQKTMSDAIAWSYQLLSEPAKALFRALSVFAGGATHAAAQAVSGDADFLGNLTELVDAGLVQAVPRVTLLATIREYGLARLHGAGEHDTMAQRHSAYFLAVAEQATVTSPVLAQEQDNLRTVLDRALRNPDPDVAMRLCAALWRFWFEQGQAAEGLGRLESALSLPGADRVPLSVRLLALTGAAQLAIDRSLFDTARRRCERLVALAGHDGAEHHLVTALTTRGQLARQENRYEEALRDYEAARVLAERSGDAGGSAAALIGLSYVLLLVGDSARAYALTEQGLAAAREAGDRRGLGDALLLSAFLALHTGEYARGDANATEAVELYRTLEDTFGTARALRTLDLIEAALGADAVTSALPRSLPELIESARDL
ncbi:ATP-binding protein [Streptosporangium sp. NPDC001559]|uniref:ATP-binding protein n=1 Tax=Streptosporangium sp. NPDC001559 TaxID=3366187 RepID=UPI0036E66E41